MTGGLFLDVFAGTAIVSQMARQDGFTVHANDWQAYSHVMQQAFLLTQGYPAYATLFAAEPALASAPPDRRRPAFGLAPDPGLRADTEPLRRVLALLEDLAPVHGPFWDAYCEGGLGGRMYFASENGARCEAVRGRIADWAARGLLDVAEEAVLKASLLETMDMLANTASVYGAFLKQVKKSAQQPFVLRLPRLFPPDGRLHGASCQDATAFAKTAPCAEIAYLDPPYNQRQYHANYHVLETIARWDLHTFEPRGVTGLRPGTDQRSDFSSKRHVGRAFAELIAALPTRALLVSYNDEGILPEAELTRLLSERAAGGRVDPHKLGYKRFRADSDHDARRYAGDTVKEFLFYADVPQPVGGE